MGKRQLLFVTYCDENPEDGASYAIELAKAMYEDITLLIVRKQANLIQKLDNLMTAVSFAEAGEDDTARQMMKEGGNGREKEKGQEGKLDAIIKKCSLEGIELNIQTSELDAVSGIRKYLKENAGIDKVVLSPAITEVGNVTAKDLNRLVRTASRPIVTMTRAACAVPQ